MQVVIWGADQSTTVMTVPLLAVPIDPVAMEAVTQAAEAASAAAGNAEQAASDAQVAAGQAAGAVAGEVTRATAAEDALGVRIGAVEPILRTITNASATADRNLNTYTAPGFDVVINPNGEGGLVSNAPPSGANAVPVNARFSTRRRGDSVVMIWYDASGQVFERAYAGATWGAWAWVDQSGRVFSSVNVSALGPSGRDLNICTALGVTYTGDGSTLVFNCPLEIDDQGGAIDGTARFNGKLTVMRDGPYLRQTYWDTRKGTENPFVRWLDAGTLAPVGAWRYLVEPAKAAAVGPRMVCFGDSITRGQALPNFDPDAYVTAVAGAFGSPMTMLAVAGRQMSGTTAGDFIPVLDNPANAAAISAAEIIWIAYGTNDWNRSVPIGSIADTANGTFYGAMREGLTKLRALNPTAKVCFLTPIYRGTSATNPTEAGIKGGYYVEDYRAAIRAFCAANGISIAEMCLNSEINGATATTYLTDGLHPGRAGHRVMSDRLIWLFERWKWAMRA